MSANLKNHFEKNAFKDLTRFLQDKMIFPIKTANQLYLAHTMDPPFPGIMPAERLKLSHWYSPLKYLICPFSLLIFTVSDL